MRTRNILNETIQNISSYLGIDRETARLVKNLIRGKIDPEIFPNVEQWVNSCYNEPSATGKILEALNSILKGSCIEAIENERKWIDHYYMYINYLYINSGDVYNPTIFFDTKEEKFFLSSFGDVVELDNL